MLEDLLIPDERDGFALLTEPMPMAGPHTHEELEVNLVLRGSAAYVLNDRRYDLRQNVLVWLFPGQEHLFLNFTPDYRAWILVFKNRLLTQSCRTPSCAPLLESNPEGQFLKHLAPSQSLLLDALFTQVAQSRQTDLFNAGLHYALMSAWETFRASDDAPTGVRIHPSVELAIRLLQEETEPQTVEHLAHHVGISPSHLSRLFGQQMGLSLTDFRNDLRLERFLRLYAQKHITLEEAALETGFGSYAQFYAVFKKKMGCGPAEYLRGHRVFIAPGGAAGRE
jgi:AraC-like DNA-binding protein